MSKRPKYQPLAEPTDGPRIVHTIHGIYGIAQALDDELYADLPERAQLLVDGLLALTAQLYRSFSDGDEVVGDE